MSRGSALADFFGELITDLRHKLVEEPWFGRAVTPSHEPAKDEPVADLGWIAWRDAEPSAQEQEGPGHGHDVGR
jgi:hypothetical protein